jgi:hypothetical protein
MPNNGAYNNQAANAGERNVGPVGLTRLPVAGSMPAGVIFQDAFDDQPDWTPRPAVGNDYTTFRWTGDESVLPASWDAVWNSEADAAIHNLEITDSMFPGHGRVLRCRRLNRSGGTGWNSNGVLGKLLSQLYQRIYLEFYISFQVDWTGDETGTSKVFRVFHSTGATDEFWSAFSGGTQGPLFLWDWSSSTSYGIRNRLSFRGGPPDTNYSMGNTDLVGIGRDIVGGSLGDVDMNFSDHIQGKLTGGLSPQIPDKLNGGFLPTSGVVRHQQLFGAAGTRTKMGFYLEMNSAPGVADGVFKQYIDDVLVVDSEAVRWVDSASGPMPGWNAFALGGNDNWAGGSWTDEDNREEFYELSMPTVSDSLPDGLA